MDKKITAMLLGATSVIYLLPETLCWIIFATIYVGRLVIQYRNKKKKI